MVDKSEKNKCPVLLQPMEKWIGEEDSDKCRPCLLGPVVQWYRDELREKGQSRIAEKLENLGNETSVDDPQSLLTLCKELDNIKSTVESSLRERLEDFDCAAQSFNPDDEVEH